MARKMAKMLPGVSVDDLVGAGYEALTLAALRYDPESGVPFSGFAHYRVRGAMIDAARRANPTARRYARALRGYEATQAVLEEASQREGASAAQDHRSLRERVEAAARLVDQTAAAVLLVRARPLEPDAVGVAEDAEQHVDTLRLGRRVRQALAACNPDDQALVEALYDRGLSATAYAEELGQHKSTVSRAHTRVLADLAKALARADRAPKPPDS